MFLLVLINSLKSRLSLEELPENARAYIRFVEKAIGAPIDIISTGPDRVQTIVLRHSFEF